MLQTAMNFRKAFEVLKSENQKYTYLPSPEEWKSVGVLCNLLEVFRDATEVILGTKYPTSNLYFHHMWKIKLILENELQTAEQEDNSNSEVAVADEPNSRFLKEMIKILKEMKKKFNKY
jgi:hypothetical protein